MFSERWICFCCRTMPKPARRTLVAPIEESQNPPAPEIRSELQIYQPVATKGKKKSDISMYF